MLGELRRVGKGCHPHATQLLLTKVALGHQTQLHTQLGVVAPLRVRVQRQMVGKQVDVVGQQQLQALLHPARHSAALPAPEQAVVHKNRIGVCRNGGFDQRAAGCDA